MIEAHLFDSWTRDPDRASSSYRYAIMVGGMGTTLFLMLAGLTVALSAGSKLRRTGDAATAAHAVFRHGLVIFGLAFVFRFQSWILGWSPNPRDLLKVDILNIMGLSVALAALLWRSVSSGPARCRVFAAATGAVAFLTPIVRSLPLDGLPDPIEAYLVPIKGLSNFVFFPWIGFVFAGAAVGVLLDGTRDRLKERRLNLYLALGGAGLAACAFAASLAPSAFTASDFWTSSPSYFFIRVGLVMLAVAVAYQWMVMREDTFRWSPIIQLGQASFFIYWIHVELVYGLISRPLHRAVSLRNASIAYVLFTGLMLLASLAKDRVVERVKLQRNAAAAA